MNKVAIVTDSNSGIHQEEGNLLGITTLPMPFSIDKKIFYENTSLSHAEFYQKLASEAKIFTSQPAVGTLNEAWLDLLQTYDEIVHIPMSSALSSSYQTATILAQEYENKVQVVDSNRISVTQKRDVLTALQLAKQGKSAKEIKDILEKTKFDSSIYIAVNTLEYLRKGGRITPTVALLGDTFKIKPILQIQGKKIDSFSKSRTMHKAITIMMNKIEEDIITKIDPAGHGENAYICVAHSDNEELALEVKQQLEQKYPYHTVICDPLSLSIVCHIGPKAIAIAVCKKIV